jgi:hypothetical protein
MYGWMVFIFKNHTARWEKMDVYKERISIFQAGEQH